MRAGVASLPVPQPMFCPTVTLRACAPGSASSATQRQRRLPGRAVVGEVVPAHHVVDLARGQRRAVRGWRAADAGDRRARTWSIRHSVAASTRRRRWRRSGSRLAPAAGGGRCRAARVAGAPACAVRPRRSNAAQQHARAIGARSQSRHRSCSRVLVAAAGQSAGILAEAARSKRDAALSSARSRASPPGLQAGRRASSAIYPSAHPLGGRPMAGHQVLVLRIGVRIPAPQLGRGWHAASE